MQLNWKRFLVMFVLFNSVLLMSGCGWVGAANALWPAITVAVTAIFTFLTNLKVSNPTLQKIQADVAAALAEGKVVLAQLAQDASATVAQKFNDVLQAIVASLNTLLQAVGVTDPTKLSTLTKLIDLGIAALEAVLGIIPLTTHTAMMSEVALVHADKATTTHIKNTHKVLQHDYHAVVSTPTGDVETDAALAGLPQQLP